MPNQENISFGGDNFKKPIAAVSAINVRPASEDNNNQPQPSSSFQPLAIDIPGSSSSSSSIARDRSQNDIFDSCVWVLWYVNEKVNAPIKMDDIKTKEPIVENIKPGTFCNASTQTPTYEDETHLTFSRIYRNPEFQIECTYGNQRSVAMQTKSSFLFYSKLFRNRKPYKILVSPCYLDPEMFFLQHVMNPKDTIAHSQIKRENRNLYYLPIPKMFSRYLDELTQYASEHLCVRHLFSFNPNEDTFLVPIDLCKTNYKENPGAVSVITKAPGKTSSNSRFFAPTRHEGRSAFKSEFTPYTRKTKYKSASPEIVKKAKMSSSPTSSQKSYRSPKDIIANVFSFNLSQIQITSKVSKKARKPRKNNLPQHSIKYVYSFFGSKTQSNISIANDFDDDSSTGVETLIVSRDIGASSCYMAMTNKYFESPNEKFRTLKRSTKRGIKNYVPHSYRVMTKSKRSCAISKKVLKMSKTVRPRFIRLNISENNPPTSINTDSFGIVEPKIPKFKIYTKKIQVTNNFKTSTDWYKKVVKYASSVDRFVPKKPYVPEVPLLERDCPSPDEPLEDAFDKPGVYVEEPLDDLPLDENVSPLSSDITYETYSKIEPISPGFSPHSPQYPAPQRFESQEDRDLLTPLPIEPISPLTSPVLHEEPADVNLIYTITSMQSSSLSDTLVMELRSTASPSNFRIYGLMNKIMYAYLLSRKNASQETFTDYDTESSGEDEDKTDLYGSSNDTVDLLIYRALAPPPPGITYTAAQREEYSASILISAPIVIYTMLEIFQSDLHAPHADFDDKRVQMTCQYKILSFGIMYEHVLAGVISQNISPKKSIPTSVITTTKTSNEPSRSNAPETRDRNMKYIKKSRNNSYITVKVSQPNFRAYKRIKAQLRQYKPPYKLNVSPSPQFSRGGFFSENIKSRANIPMLPPRLQLPSPQDPQSSTYEQHRPEPKPEPKPILTRAVVQTVKGKYTPGSRHTIKSKNFSKTINNVLTTIHSDHSYITNTSIAMDNQGEFEIYHLPRRKFYRNSKLNLSDIHYVPLHVTRIVYLRHKPDDVGVGSTEVLNPLYDRNGMHIDSQLDICDCFSLSCPGCHPPCFGCKSQKCGSHCRCNRSFMYNNIIYEGLGLSVTIKNTFLRDYRPKVRQVYLSSSMPSTSTAEHPENPLIDYVFTQKDNESIASDIRVDVRMYEEELPAFYNASDSNAFFKKSVEYQSPPVFIERMYKRRTHPVGVKQKEAPPLYDQNGIHINSKKDLCDCFLDCCPGCHYPCFSCNSLKCGPVCRRNRTFLFDEIEYKELGLIFTNSRTFGVRKYKHNVYLKPRNALAF